MRKLWTIIIMATTLAAAGLLSAASELARAGETGTQPQLASIMGETLNRGLLAKPAPHYVSHELCGIGLGGYCPRGYRGCTRAGRPKAECDARLERCEACNHAMVECRQKVGHQAGYTCAECRQALDKCRAGLSAPIK